MLRPMSYLATVLEELREANGLTQSAVSKLSGIPQSQVSRWINGELGSISDDDLIRLSKVFPKRNEQAQLLRARLMDLCSGPAKDMIEVSITNGTPSLAEDSVPYKTKLPPKDEKALALLREHMSIDRKLRDMVLALAEYCKPKA